MMALLTTFYFLFCVLFNSTFAVSVRLSGNSSMTTYFAYGRVEINYNGTWGTVCDRLWDDDEATVVCKMLGYQYGIAIRNAKYGKGTGPVILDRAYCRPYHKSLEECSFLSWTTNCSHEQDAGIACNIRLAGKASISTSIAYGRVEVYYNGSWGTVCDSNWNINEARVVCKMFGYSQIYCYGPLLEAVQMANLFQDSKTFVDMNLKSSPVDVLAKFKQLGNYSKDDLYKFVTDHFAGPGEELQQWQPPDFIENPSFLADIQDADLKDFAKHLCKIWSDLGKTVNIDVKQNPGKYSFLYLENPFIVPGKRFREVYYWDSYWIIKGLLACQMQTTVKGMLENIISLVKRLGFVPNGGRIYYTMRSQPPFLIPMMYEYYRTTHDLKFLQDNIQYLEEEYEFWQRNRSVSILKNGKTHQLNHYASPVNRPRPESYKEDIITFEGMTEVEKRTLLPHITSACESGWDFSSRWMKRDPYQPLTLNTTITNDIIPVDLNSVLCWNEKIMAYFYNISGNVSKSDFFQAQHNRRRASIQDVLWNDDVGIWQDYSVSHDSHRDYFYASHIYPLFADCVSNDPNFVESEKRIIAYLEQQQVLHYEGGVPASTINTTQQWDFPNAWPPLQHVMIKSLARGKLQTTRDKALNLTSKWIYSNWKGWKQTGKMFEKYDATKPGKRGGGGEYDVQEGFGWTNGVVLDLLKEYGNQLSLHRMPQFDCTNDGAFLKEYTTCKSKGTTLDILMCFILSFTIFIFNFLTSCQRT